MKPLEENLAINLCDIKLEGCFLYMALKAQQQKENIKLDFIKINFCALRDAIKKVKKTIQRMGENICKSNIWKETTGYTKNS